MAIAVEDEVRAASKQFYTALTRMAQGDASGMAEVWSRDSATTMHPIGGREVGWNDVRQSWEQVARVASGGAVELRDALLHVSGDLAVESGIERGSMQIGSETVPIDQRVTNIYRREVTGWRIVHHHADLSASMVDLLQRSRPE